MALTMTRPEVYCAVRSYARNAISAGELPAVDLPTGVKAVDLWHTTPFGSVLFFGEATSGLFSFNFPSLHAENVRRRTVRGWVGANGGGVGLHEPYYELLADAPPGIHALGHSQSPEARLTFGYATSEVARIRLINDQQIRLHPVVSTASSYSAGPRRSRPHAWSRSDETATRSLQHRSSFEAIERDSGLDRGGDRGVSPSGRQTPALRRRTGGRRPTSAWPPRPA